MRVLVVRLGAFGDIIHTLPLAADLAAAGHSVGWLCEDRWAPVLTGSAAVSRLHLLPRKLLRQAPIRDRVLALSAVVRDVRSGAYDVVIDAQGLAKSALLAWVSGAATRLGHARPRAREGAQLLTHQRYRSPAVQVIDQQRDLARLLGVTPTGPWRFPLPAWSAERAAGQEFLAQAGLVRPWALNVGAGWPTKVWPVARQGEFLALLRSQGIPALVVWGSPAERTVAEQVIAAAGHGVLAPPTTIPALAGLLAQVAVLVSGDTGPLHLALALGTPAIGLFGPVPAERNGPQGLGYANLQAPGAAWERRDVSKVDMGAITPEAVVAAARGVVHAVGNLGNGPA
jgi:heptosyltransferase-1